MQEPVYKVNRIDGVVGGYITFNNDIFCTLQFDRVIDVLRADMGAHRDHTFCRYVFHAQNDLGVAAPLDEIGTMGWKCSPCDVKGDSNGR